MVVISECTQKTKTGGKGREEKKKRNISRSFDYHGMGTSKPVRACPQELTKTVPE